MATQYLKVKNFERFQHYKDRNPPWIKLYNDLLDDYEFGRLQDASKWLAIGLWLLASRYNNRIPADPEWIGRRINATEPVDLQPLLNAGFITMYEDASDTLAGRKQDDDLETETETERETERETSSPPPPPPSRARARAEEGHHPGPDAAGQRLAADGEGESRDQPEPDRLALIREMQAAVEARARKLRGERRQARFVARAKAIIGGDDYTVWRDGHGRAAPWPDRPRLLRLALARTEGEDDPDLRAALRYVVLQQLDPVEPPTAEELRGHRPPPGSEAAAVRDELPQQNGHHTSELVRVGVWMAGDDPAEREQERLDALVREWEQQNPAEAAALRERIAREVADDPAWKGVARAALPGLVRSRYRLAVRDLLERQEVAT